MCACHAGTFLTLALFAMRANEHGANGQDVVRCWFGMFVCGARTKFLCACLRGMGAQTDDFTILCLLAVALRLLLIGFPNSIACTPVVISGADCHWYELAQWKVTGLLRALVGNVR